MIALLLAMSWLILSPMTTIAGTPVDPPVVKSESTEPLGIYEVLCRIELAHPLLKGAETQREYAKGKILKAMGQWEPTFVNDTEYENYDSWNLTNVAFPRRSLSSGFNDSTIHVGHPWGLHLFAGYRHVVGDTISRRDVLGSPVALGVGGGIDQFVVGGSLHLLRGLFMNPERAYLQHAEISGPMAENEIQQKRQDLYLAGAVQYWDWQVAVKQAEVQQRALIVAEDRNEQVQGRAKAGAVAPLDAIEAEQEVQRRREAAIAAQRKVEYEQYKLSLFLWEGNEPVTPRIQRAPEFQGETPVPTDQEIDDRKSKAKKSRPEVQAIYLEAMNNNVDLALAKNNMLPSLDIDGGPAPTATDFILGIGMRAGLVFKMPLFQREARGQMASAQANAERLVLKQKYTEQQVTLDVDNWHSAIVRARERVKAATESLRLAKALEDGERTRFKLGATNILFVNLRERNAVEAEYQLFRAQADYAVSRGGLLWATGELATPVLIQDMLAKYAKPNDPVAKPNK
jgi:outer membrane protein TolC